MKDGKQTILFKLISLFPYILILTCGVGLVIIPLIMSRLDTIIKSFLLILPIGISGVYLLIRYRNKPISNEIDSQNSLFNIHLSEDKYYWYTSYIFVFLYLFSIIVLITSESRTFAYFATISLIAGTICWQIIYRPHVHTKPPVLLLVEIMFLSLNLAWGVTLKYGLYYGWTDTLVHLNLIEIMLSTGHSSGFDPSYQSYPLYHILISAGSMLTGMSPKLSLFIIMGILWQIGLLLSYMIFKRLCNSISTALLACLLFAFSSQIIFYSYYPVTRSLALIIVLVLTYLIISWKPKAPMAHTFLILLITWVLILTHHATALFVIPLMVTIFILKRITKERGKDNFLNPTYIVLFFVEFTSYLIWGSYDFTTSQGMAKITAILSGGESTVPALVSKVGPLITPNGIYYAVILFLSLIGIGYIFYQKNDKSTKNLLYLAIACFIFLIAYIPGPLDFIPKASSLLLWRIPLLVSPVIAFCAALGIKSILIWPGTAERINPPKYKVVAVVLILVVITTFFSTLADSNAHDSLELNTLPKDSSYFSGVELVALSFMYDYVDKNVPIYSDYPTIRNNIYDQNQFETANIISNGNISYIDYGYLILRAGQLEDRNCLLFSTSEGESSSFVYSLDENDPASNILYYLRLHERIYDGRDVQSYNII